MNILEELFEENGNTRELNNEIIQALTTILRQTNFNLTTIYTRWIGYGKSTTAILSDVCIQTFRRKTYIKYLSYIA